MLLGENSRTVSTAVADEVREINRVLPRGVRIDPFYDRTELVEKTLRTVGRNLAEGGALVILVLLVMLRNLRAGLVGAAMIPLCTLGAFIGMRAAGVSGNLMSLGALDFGLLVDGAIILLENAVHHLAARREALGRALTAKERDAVVLESAREVRSATAFGELIIALVYVPVLALEGVEGKMFHPMALTVLFALATAFALSLTLVPAAASIILSRETRDQDLGARRAAGVRAAPRDRAAPPAGSARGGRGAAGVERRGGAIARVGVRSAPRRGVDRDRGEPPPVDVARRVRASGRRDRADAPALLRGGHGGVEDRAPRDRQRPYGRRAERRLRDAPTARRVASSGRSRAPRGAHVRRAARGPSGRGLRVLAADRDAQQRAPEWCARRRGRAALRRRPRHALVREPSRGAGALINAGRRRRAGRPRRGPPGAPRRGRSRGCRALRCERRRCAFGDRRRGRRDGGRGDRGAATLSAANEALGGSARRRRGAASHAAAPGWEARSFLSRPWRASRSSTSRRWSITTPVGAASSCSATSAVATSGASSPKRVVASTGPRGSLRATTRAGADSSKTSPARGCGSRSWCPRCSR